MIPAGMDRRKTPLQMAQPQWVWPMAAPAGLGPKAIPRGRPAAKAASVTAHPDELRHLFLRKAAGPALLPDAVAQ